MNKEKLRQLIRECINSSGIRETADPREVNVFGYQTKHFDVCPGAQGLYLRIVEENLVDNKDLAIQSKRTGLEIQKILNLTDQFDTFEGAATAAGKLNSVLESVQL